MLPLASYSITYAPVSSGERAFRGGAGALAISGSGTDSSVHDQSSRAVPLPLADENGLDLSRQRSSVPFAFLPQIPETPLATYSASFMAQLLGQDEDSDFTAALFGRGGNGSAAGLFGDGEGILVSQLAALAGAANDNLAAFARTQPAKSKPLAKASGVTAYLNSNQRLRDVVRL